MQQPIRVLQAGTDNATGYCAEVLRCEGLPWLDEQPAETFDGLPGGVELLVVAGTGLSRSAADRLASAVTAGATLIAVSPDPRLASAFGVRLGEPLTDAHLVAGDLPGWEHGPVPLLCPDDTARPLRGGRPLAELHDGAGLPRGAGIVDVRLGEGRAVLYGYDLGRTIATLRHGTGEHDERSRRDMGPLYGPRHIYGFFELSNKLPRDTSVSDLHQDILRSLAIELLAGTALPRLWYFPGGAPALWFVKGDGCGETGADELVELLEGHGAFLSFNRPPTSRYGGDLARAWHERGHGMSIEADISRITQVVEEIDGRQVRRGRSVAEVNTRWLPTIRENIRQHRDAFIRETGLAMETICIHGCQWTGLAMARMVRELGFYTPTHFISHDPRMRRDERYGPYMIATGLPLRYYDREAGLLDLWHMPAQWDESQTIGRHQDLLAGPMKDAPERVAGMVGLTAAEYGVELARFARDAAARWHVVQIANFHPLYATGPQDHPRASRRALEMGLDGARAAGCHFANQEKYSRFARARAVTRLARRWREDGAEFVTLISAEGVDDLTLLLPDRARDARLADTGAALAERMLRLEGRPQRAIDLSLPAGEPVTLCLALNG